MRVAVHVFSEDSAVIAVHFSMAASNRSGRKSVSNAPGSARAKCEPQVWRDIEEALQDPGLVDPGDPNPSPSAIRQLKEVIEETQERLHSPIPSPHVELFEGSIRLIWQKADINIRLVIASLDDRRSYLYHEHVSNGRGHDEGMADPTPPNLAHWLTVMQDEGDRARQ